ncbi:MAG: hypothetical protein ACRDTC_13805 [Pseudonocardiaceae bacterium]
MHRHRHGLLPPCRRDHRRHYKNAENRGRWARGERGKVSSRACRRRDRVAVEPLGEEVTRTAQVQFGGEHGRLDLDRAAALVGGYRTVLTASPNFVPSAATPLPAVLRFSLRDDHRGTRFLPGVPASAGRSMYLIGIELLDWIALRRVNEGGVALHGPEHLDVDAALKIPAGRWLSGLPPGSRWPAGP